MIKRLHYFSGIYITLFIILHLINHLSSIFGIEYHLEVMDHLRKFYRNPIAEILLLTAIGFQIFSGIKLFFIKRKIVKTFFEKLQIWSGLYLAFFFIIHLGAVLAGRYILELDTNFYFGAAGLNTFPFNLFFIPYYSLAIFSFFGHIAGIHANKMKNSILGITVKQQSTIILINGIIMTIFVVYGMTNGFCGIVLPQEYKVLIGQ